MTRDAPPEGLHEFRCKAAEGDEFFVQAQAHAEAKLVAEHRRPGSRVCNSVVWSSEWAGPNADRITRRLW